MRFPIVVSGGQTGCDRGALDAAITLNLTCDGWCPEGRLAEDGIIPAKYPLKELKGGDYEARTLQNVLDSDGTVIFYFFKPEGGTEKTLFFCIEYQKPYLLIDGSFIGYKRAGKLIAKFIKQYRISRLNVAGPRASKEKKAYHLAKKSLIEAAQAFHCK